MQTAIISLGDQLDDLGEMANQGDLRARAAMHTITTTLKQMTESGGELACGACAGSFSAKSRPITGFFVTLPKEITGEGQSLSAPLCFECVAVRPRDEVMEDIARTLNHVGIGEFHRTQ